MRTHRPGALRQDVDLVAGRLVVERDMVRGKVGSPKSGRSREIALGDGVLAALKRACKRAGLRPIGWHVLRHTCASHLAPLNAVQELLGHATILMTMRHAHLSPDIAQDAGEAAGRSAWQRPPKER